MGKYDPLRDYLVGCGSDEVTLSFADIESIVGFPLPASASNYDAWWANTGDGLLVRHSHARSWQDAGYRAQANRASGTVRFYKPSEEMIVPIVDWNGNGRVDPVDFGISASIGNIQGIMDDERPRIALISCSKQKKAYACPARELYSASTLFALSYEYARRNADRSYILSAKHGLVGEEEIIEPYNETLNEKSVHERKTWAQMVVRQLKQVSDIRRDSFIILAGRHYYEYLLPHLSNVELPLGNLPLGSRVGFLQRNLEFPTGAIDDPSDDALHLHRLFARLPEYDWQGIDDIPFRDGIYIVYESGETYKGQARVVRVGTHTSPGRLKQRLKDHFLRENHNGSIFRKNIGKAMLNRDRDPYLSVWGLDTSKPPYLGREDRAKEAEVEREVSAYMRENLTFRVFPVETQAERLRLEAAIIATLHRAEDFTASDRWLGNSSPEAEIRQSGMWLKQGLEAAPLTDAETLRLSQLVMTSERGRTPGPERPLNPTRPSLSLEIGDRVRHDVFGDGTVLSVRDFSPDRLAEIDFGENGVRKLMLLQAEKRMKKLN